MLQELNSHNIQHRDSIPHYCNSQNNKLWCKKSAARKSLAIQRKMSSNKEWYSKRKDLCMNSYEYDTYKKVVLACRGNITIKLKNGNRKKLSYAKLAGAFLLSSRTVLKWCKPQTLYLKSRTVCGTLYLKSRIFVNVKQIAYALQTWLNAYRNGWVEEINIFKVLQGDADP